ncbi:MAG: DUF4342 domain-containing protein [Candidatus Aminicenantales bacterium]
MTDEEKSRKTRTEEFKVNGAEIIQKLREILHQGNVRRIILKSEEGKTFMEIPLTVGLVGALIAPVWAAIGAIAALVSKLTIVVEKTED